MKGSSSTNDRKEGRSCAKKLFFPKKLPQRGSQANPNEGINSVTSLLGKVAIDHEAYAKGTELNVGVLEGTTLRDPCTIKEASGTEVHAFKEVAARDNNFESTDNHMHCMSLVEASTDLSHVSSDVHYPSLKASNTSKRVQKWKKTQ